MLDPVKNAKTIGLLFIILGVLDTFLGVAGFINLGIGLRQVDMLVTMVNLILGIGYLAIGIGLRKTKLWGVYGLGIAALIQLGVFILGIINGTGLSVGVLIISIITILFFIWFYSVRARFIN
ncbi:MAG: hypothetical protein V1808_03050 [Candidatus Daviesbacteria bacterium]